MQFFYMEEFKEIFMYFHIRRYFGYWQEALPLYQIFPLLTFIKIRYEALLSDHPDHGINYMRGCWKVLALINSNSYQVNKQFCIGERASCSDQDLITSLHFIYVHVWILILSWLTIEVTLFTACVNFFLTINNYRLPVTKESNMVVCR